jgi:molybdopterin-guanine dinucleotide biosynthesis protein A
MTLVDKSISVFILAGGKSSRMGEDKGLVHLAGKPMIEYLLQRLSKLGLSISIITSNVDYQKFGYPIYPDLIPDKGPMGGLYTALSISESSKILLVSCDSPLIPLEVFRALIDISANSNLVVSRSEERIYPFPGVYNQSILFEIEKNLQEDSLKMITAIEKLVPEYLFIDQVIEERDRWKFANVNNMAELKILEGKLPQR